jgi:NADH-quinone oxidoreductase subunit F
MGGKEYAKMGTPNNTGTRIWSVSGDVQKPGYYEFPCGAITFGELIYEVCGGLAPGRKLKAVIPGGTSAKILSAAERFKGKMKDGSEYDWGIEDVPLDFDSLAMIGSMSGSAAVIVLDDSRNMVDVLANISAFYAHESCGQCTPCREGSLWLKKITERMCNGGAREEDADLIISVAKQIDGRTICAHGEATAWPAMSITQKFKDDFIQRARMANE